MENNIAESVDGSYLYTGSTYIRFEWALACSARK